MSPLLNNNFELNVWYIGFFLFLLLVYLLYVHFIIKIKMNSDEYTILNHAFKNIVILYKDQIYSHKYEKLIRTYDLEENSPTNANKQFKTQLDSLLHISTVDIMKNYLTIKMSTRLLKYYSYDTIVLNIIDILGGVNRHE